LHDKVIASSSAAAAATQDCRNLLADQCIIERRRAAIKRVVYGMDVWTAVAARADTAEHIRCGWILGQATLPGAIACLTGLPDFVEVMSLASVDSCVARRQKVIQQRAQTSPHPHPRVARAQFLAANSFKLAAQLK